MDVKQIEYIVKIAETGSITRAAEQLFITQSALNQQLLKLEQSLGVKLFIRHKHDMTPTEAGNVYLKYGRHMLQEKREAYTIINDMSQNNVGKLYFTFARERGINMFCSTYSVFHQKFPGITLEPHEMLAQQQMARIAQGYVDLGLVTVSEDDKLPGLEYECIRKEPILLAVPRSFPQAAKAARPGTPLEDLPYGDLKDLRDLPFVLMFESSTMRHIIDKLFRQHHFSPYVLFESASIRTLETMVKTDLACTIVSGNYYKYQDRIAYFRLPGDPEWELDIVYKKGAYLSKPMLYYKELMQEYFHEKAPLITKKKV